MSQEPSESRAYAPGIATDDLLLIQKHTSPAVWRALSGQRIFITGGTGFIGCWLLETLLWADKHFQLGLSLLVLTRNPAAFSAKAPHLACYPSLQLVQGDVTDLGFFNESVDIVLHAATDVANAGSKPQKVFDDIVNGTKQTLDLAVRCKARRYLLTSSGAVYGRQPDDMTHIPESYMGAPDTLQPGTAYGQGKRVSEWLVQCTSVEHQLESRVARVFALLGPYLPLDAHFAAGNFIRDAMAGKEIKVGGDGTAYRSYLYTADMVIWLLTILIEGAAGQAYNLGSDQAISIRQLAAAVSSVVLGEERVSVSVTAPLGVPVQRYVPDIDKARRDLKLFVHTDLSSAIRKTVDWTIMRSSSSRAYSGNS
ncbi:NAD-dependent epimerase/dehydratase family protein [Janthinobacterium lividum]|uniref:NAD-dependent epimerase/dehydratase family protein n=1 Tax=Janthinobacterium lividum TaxID=29581 RepID=UPI00068D53F0|nr:NAD-dependent epimerase/dehydratase family protein [Janthinobacterium lividum]QKY05607.1 NAD-dependent epimerase/dehydratase family protein [Janthinobacterium lividum]